MRTPGKKIFNLLGILLKDLFLIFRIWGTRNEAKCNWYLRWFQEYQFNLKHLPLDVQTGCVHLENPQGCELH